MTAGTSRPVAAINDDATEVGQVHFGVVHIVRVPDENVATAATALRPQNYPDFRSGERSVRLRIVVAILFAESFWAAFKSWVGHCGEQKVKQGQTDIQTKKKSNRLVTFG